MKSLRTVRLSLIAGAVAVAGATISTPAMAGVAASAGVTNIYLWRGQSLSGSTPAVYGGLEYDHSTGLYAGAWATSSSGGGSENDLYAGYKGSSGDFSYAAAYYAYQYPADVTTKSFGGTYYGSSADPQSLDFQEVYLTAGYKALTLEAYLGVGGTGGVIVDKTGAEKDKNNYFDVQYTYGQFTGKVGTWVNDVKNTNYTHADLTYKYNDNISFTVSDVVTGDKSPVTGKTISGDPLFQVAYTLPIDFNFSPKK